MATLFRLHMYIHTRNELMDLNKFTRLLMFKRNLKKIKCKLLFLSFILIIDILVYAFSNCSYQILEIKRFYVHNENCFKKIKYGIKVFVNIAAKLFRHCFSRMSMPVNQRETSKNRFSLFRLIIPAKNII